MHTPSSLLKKKHGNPIQRYHILYYSKLLELPRYILPTLIPRIPQTQQSTEIHNYGKSAATQHRRTSCFMRAHMYMHTFPTSTNNTQPHESYFMTPL